MNEKLIADLAEKLVQAILGPTATDSNALRYAAKVLREAYIAGHRDCARGLS